MLLMYIIPHFSHGNPSRMKPCHPPVWIASMRPWHFSHGNLRACVRRRRAMTGFNEAVAFQPRKSDPIMDCAADIP